MDTNIREVQFRFLGTAAILGLALLAFFLLAGAAVADSGSRGGDFRFKAELTGTAEVPAVATETDGRAEVRVDDDREEAEFRIRVDDGIAVTQSHLHCAPAGQNGPVIAFLFGLEPGGVNVDGDLARGELTDADILPAGATCTVPVHDIASLAHAMQAGIIYANVHTVAHPGGEIRGQLMDD